MAKDNNLKVVGNVSAPPSKFRLVPAFQGRAVPVNDDDLHALAQSMLKEGQQQPIQVRAIANTDEYEVIFGNTRVRAGLAIINGVKDAADKWIIKPDTTFKLRAEIVEVDDSEAFRRNVIENAMRNQCTAIDNALNQERLRKEQDMSDAAIARLYGYNQANVTRLKALLELPEDIQNVIHQGGCSARAGYMLATAKDVAAAGAFDAVWMKLKDGTGENIHGGTQIGEADMAAAIKQWRTEQKEQATTTTEGTTTTNPDGTTTTVPAGEGSTGGTAAPATPTPTIGLSYKVFKDTFRDAVNSDRVPPKCKDLCQMILDFADGKVEDKDFTQFLLATTGEELLPEPQPIPGQDNSAAVDASTNGTTVESPVPQQQPTGKRKVERKAQGS